MLKETTGILLACLTQLAPDASGRGEDHKLREQVLAVVHAACHEDVVFADGHGEVLAARDWNLILGIALDSLPAHRLRVKHVHVRWANLHTGVDPLERDHSGEEEDLVVGRRALLDVDGARAERLDDGPFVGDSAPLLLRWVDFVDLEVELACDHRRPPEKVQLKLAVFENRHQGGVFASDGLS